MMQPALRHGHGRIREAALLFILSVLVAGGALADGAYMPEQAVRKPPAIPAQTALIVFRDGQEQLIVESALDGEGQSFGWIVPVPAQPTELAEASPGLLRTLELNCGPDITHDLWGQLKWAVVIAVVLPLVALWAFSPKKSLLGILLLLLVIAVLAGLMMPALGAAGAGGARAVPGVRLEQAARVGSYDVAVLEADSAGAFGQWLEANGYASLTEKGRAIVADYVRDRWHFVAAKLRREGDGLSVPHPLSITFPAAEPVYPMRLTAIAGSDVYVDLFVVADGRAGSERLPLEFCDTYLSYKAAGRSIAVMDGSGERALPGFISQAYRSRVGHPRALDLMWDGCTLTRLSGLLRPEEMDADISITLRDAEPFRAHYYSRQGARHVGGLSGLVLWTVLVPVGLFCLRRRRCRACSDLPFVSVVGTGCILLALVVYIWLPKVDVQPLSPSYMWWPGESINQASDAGALDGSTTAEVRENLKNWLERRPSENIFTGGPVRLEDSPGNLEIIEDERGIVVRTFDMEGFPQGGPVSALPLADPGSFLP